MQNKRPPATWSQVRSAVNMARLANRRVVRASRAYPQAKGAVYMPASWIEKARNSRIYWMQQARRLRDELLRDAWKLSDEETGYSGE